MNIYEALSILVQSKSMNKMYHLHTLPHPKPSTTLRPRAEVLLLWIAHFFLALRYN